MVQYVKGSVPTNNPVISNLETGLPMGFIWWSTEISPSFLSLQAQTHIVPHYSLISVEWVLSLIIKITNVHYFEKLEEYKKYKYY